MLTSVRYLSRLHAEAMALLPTDAVISITQPDGPLACLSGDPHEVVRPAFFDIVSEGQRSDGRDLLPISSAQADLLVATLDRWHSLSKSLALIVHCEAGISRSAAVARFVAEAYGVVIFDGKAELASITVLHALRRAPCQRAGRATGVSDND